jgi:hypothetical protein
MLRKRRTGRESVRKSKKRLWICQGQGSACPSRTRDFSQRRKIRSVVAVAAAIAERSAQLAIHARIASASLSLQARCGLRDS